MQVPLWAQVRVTHRDNTQFCSPIRHPGQIIKFVFPHPLPLHCSPQISNSALKSFPLSSKTPCLLCHTSACSGVMNTFSPVTHSTLMCHFCYGDPRAMVDISKKKKKKVKDQFWGWWTVLPLSWQGNVFFICWNYFFLSLFPPCYDLMTFRAVNVS